ncbi:MAG: hypothetical protein EPN38_12615 [Rhodanobacteraceae bacterium]|nr:MAG: hypothetical protein EPN38_12615 [Rhodanobacteraceae bacterium]
MHKWLVLGITGTLAAGVSIAALAQGTSGNAAAREIATAQVHARVAYKMDSVAGAQLHLHHAVNCLVGVNGTGYDAAAEKLSANPCKGLGHGALSDSAGNARLHGTLETALTDAQAGLKSDDLKTVHADAGKLVAALKAAHRQVHHQATPSSAR